MPESEPSGPELSEPNARLRSVTADPWEPGQADLYYQQSLARFNAAKALGLRLFLPIVAAPDDIVEELKAGADHTDPGRGNL